MGALGIEMEIVALFNAVLLLFSLLLRLSPHHDNLLYATLVAFLPRKVVRQVMQSLNSLALSVFAVAGVFAMAVGWWAFGLWFGVALMVSQLTEAAEELGEYRETISADTTITDRVKPVGNQSAVSLTQNYK
jgi:hypothetical protein